MSHPHTSVNDTENELRKLLEQLQIVKKSMAASVARCSRDLKYVWVSQACADWIGLPVDQIEGRPIIEVLGIEAFEQLMPHFTRVLTGQVVRYEERVLYKGIGPRWTSATYTPTMDANGTCDGWVAVILDIDERKKLEESLRQSEHRISADLTAMTHLQEVGENCARTHANVHECLTHILDTAIAVMNADKGTIQLIDENRGVLQLIAHRGFQEPFIRFFETVRRDDPSTCGTAMQTNGRIIVEDVMKSDIFVGKAALNVLVNEGVHAIQSTPLVSSTGALLGVVSTHFGNPYRPGQRELRLMDLLARTAADFLERKRAEEELQRLNNELVQADLRKNRFIAILGHELRNPLVPIRNASQILRAQGLFETRSEWACNLIDRQVVQMTRLIDDLLDISRITRDNIELRKETFDLRCVVNDAIETSRPLIEKSGHGLSLELPDAPIMLDADPTRISQVILNLISNAIKYTERGGHISISAGRDSKNVTIRVKDTGIGIAREMLPRIFEMFTRVEDSSGRLPDGLGIGLTLVQKLVTLHGGVVEAYSNGPGTGSEFIVRLPAGEPPEVIEREP